MKNDLFRFISLIFVFLFPLFFLNTTAEAYEYNKMFLLLIYTLAGLLFFTLKVIKEQKLEISSGTFLNPLLVLLFVSLLSLIFQSPNIAISLTTPLSSTAIISGILLYVLLSHLINPQDKKIYLRLLIFDAVLVSLYLLFVYLGLIPKSLVTPVGNLLSTAIFLVLIEVYLIYQLFIFFSGKDSQKHEIMRYPNWQNLYLFYGMSLLIVSITLVTLSIHLFTDQSPILLPLNFGWSIMLEVLKNIKTLFLGVGPANFITAFSLGKPLAVNTSPVWNIIFTSSSSFLLNLLTEAGFLAGMAFLYIFIRVVSRLWKFIKSGDDSAGNDQFPYHLLLFIAMLAQIVFPSSMVIFIFTILLLVFVSDNKPLLQIDLSGLRKFTYLLLLPAIFLIIAVSYFAALAYLAEVNFKYSLDSLLNNKGTQGYDFQRKAITFNPFIDRYHTALSQTNLSLANALSSQKNLSSEDAQNIPRLVQQAIDEAKTAVNLQRTNIVNWDNLVKTYTAIINYAAGAENWAIQSHQQKIALDPLSPKNRIALAILYLELNRLAEGEAVLRQAIFLKPDLPISHFHLAVTLRKQGRFDEAYQELQNAYTLLPPNSTDVNRIREELKLLPKDLTATGSMQLKQGGVELPVEEIFDSTRSGVNIYPTGLPTIEIKP